MEIAMREKMGRGQPKGEKRLKDVPDQYEDRTGSSEGLNWNR
jgi:hypothetical protein